MVTSYLVISTKIDFTTIVIMFYKNLSKTLLLKLDISVVLISLLMI